MKEKHLTTITLILLAIVLVAVTVIFAGAFSAEQQGVNSPYKEAYFNPDTVNTVSITISDENWQDILTNPLEEEYHLCSIVINGDSYDGVGIRTKGQSSLTFTARSDSDRYSFKIKADEYINGQSFNELTEFSLNSLYNDPTYMRDYLSYELMTELGVPTPLYSYAAIYINGEYFGLYIMLEAIEEDFAARNFGKNYGQLYKPEASILPSTNHSDIFLKYIDDNPSSYPSIFDNAVYTTTSTAASKERVVKAIKNLNQGNPADSVNVDEVLRFIVGLGSVVTLDSYIGNHCHNYYLYEQDGILQMIPWDFNLAFASYLYRDPFTLVNFPIDTPVVSKGALSNRPLVEKLLAVPEYRQIYHSYLKWVGENYFNSSFGEHVDDIEYMVGSMSVRIPRRSIPMPSIWPHFLN